jgi:AcrR family transcriptional regulator
METQRRILEKANEQFKRFGIRSVSMDDIAAQLGISKKTIYQYFEDKDTLVDAVMQEEEVRMHTDCSRCREASSDAVDEMFLAMDRILEQFSQMNPVVIYDLEKFYPVAYQRFQRMKNNYLYGVIRNNLLRGIEEGYYRPELDVDIVTRYRLESMMLPFNLSVYPQGKFHLTEVAREIMSLFLFGLATSKGYQLIQKYKKQKNKL